MIGARCFTALMQRNNTQHCSSLWTLVLGFLSNFFPFSAFYMEIRISQFYFDLFMKIILNSCQFSLFGSEFRNVCWSSLLGSEFLKKITFLSEFLVGIRNSMLSFLWGSAFLNYFLACFYGDQNFWKFLDFFYGDQNFWMFFGLLLWGSEFLNVFGLLLWESEFLNVFGLLLWGSQDPEEMCLSLEHQNPSKASEKMGYFDRVTVSLHIL